MPKPELRAECLRLRVEDRLSFNEIRALTGASKSSLSLWLADFPLNADELKERKINSLTKPRRRYRQELRGTESKFHKIVPANSLTNNQKGQIAEAAVRYRLSILGYELYQGINAGSKLDFLILLKNGEMAKLQIKFATTQREGLPGISMRCSNGRHGSRKYSQEECDFLIGYDYFSDTAFVFHFGEIMDKRHQISAKPENAEAWYKLDEIH